MSTPLTPEQLLALARAAEDAGQDYVQLGRATKEGDEIGAVVRTRANFKGTILRMAKGQTVIQFEVWAVKQMAQSRLYREKLKAERAARIKHRWEVMPNPPLGVEKAQRCKTCGLIKHILEDGRRPRVTYLWKDRRAQYQDRDSWNSKTPSCPPQMVGVTTNGVGVRTLQLT